MFSNFVLFCDFCQFSYKTANFQQNRADRLQMVADYEKISESAMDSMDDMRRIQIQQMKAVVTSNINKNKRFSWNIVKIADMSVIVVKLYANS